MIELKHDTYLVTGAAGFIGSHLVNEIKKRGKTVIGIDNFVNSSREDHPDVLDRDVSDFADFKNEFCNVDVVCHLAASKCTVCRQDPKRDLMTNAYGSFNVFTKALMAGVKKVIHASTGSVFNGKPRSFYGVSKLAGESYLRAFQEYYPEFNFTSIRYHHVYGPGQDASPKGGVIPIFITKLLRKEPITIFGDGFQQRNFTYVKDVVNYTLAAESRWDGQFIDLAEPDSMTILELAKVLGEIMGVTPEIVFENERPGDIRAFDICDSVMMRKDFYWAQFRQNIKETIEYYENIGLHP
jgi:UDP-glucose 4-epimerase